MPNLYETDQALSEYLLMHYGTDAELMPWPFGPADAIGFQAVRLPISPRKKHREAWILAARSGDPPLNSLKYATRSSALIILPALLKPLKKCASMAVLITPIKESGKINSRATASIPEHSHSEGIQFLCADAMNLPANLGQFDYVHAANLICRLPDPAKLLNRLPNLVLPGGYLVLATPCTWLEQFTPPENQPSEDTFEWLSELLCPSFELVKKADEPFLIRETSRKFQWTVSLVTQWKRDV